MHILASRQPNTLHIFRVLSPCSAVLPTLCDLQLLLVPRTSLSVFPTLGDHSFLPEFLLHNHGEKFLQVVMWGLFRAWLIWFPSLRDHCPLLPRVQYLESYYFIFGIYFYRAFQAGE